METDSAIAADGLRETMNQPHEEPVALEYGSQFAARATYSAASENERERTLVYMRGAINRLPYLQITKSRFDGDVREMVSIRTRPKRTRVEPETIRADPQTVWKLEVARQTHAIHRVVDTTIGFEFRFALLLEHGEFVTGVIAVDLVEYGAGHVA